MADAQHSADTKSVASGASSYLTADNSSEALERMFAKRKKKQRKQKEGESGQQHGRDRQPEQLAMQHRQHGSQERDIQHAKTRRAQATLDTPVGTGQDLRSRSPVPSTQETEETEQTPDTQRARDAHGFSGPSQDHPKMVWRTVSTTLWCLRVCLSRSATYLVLPVVKYGFIVSLTSYILLFLFDNAVALLCTLPGLSPVCVFAAVATSSLHLASLMPAVSLPPPSNTVSPLSTLSWPPTSTPSAVHTFQTPFPTAVLDRDKTAIHILLDELRRGGGGDDARGRRGAEDEE